MTQTLSRSRLPLAADEVIVATMQLALLRAQRAMLITAHDDAYERWLSYAGPKPSERKFEDAVEAIEERIDELEATLAIETELTPFEAALAADEAEARR